MNDFKAKVKANSLLLVRTLGPVAFSLIASQAMATAALPQYQQNSNPIADTITNLGTQYLLPIVQGIIGVAVVAACATMAFRPDKKEMMQQVAGIVIAGLMAEGATYLLKNFVFGGGSGVSGAGGALI